MTVPGPQVDVIGPFEYHALVVNGYEVPHITATPANGGKVWLTLDRAFALPVDVADFDGVARFIADCIAVASGYTCHPGAEGAREPIARTPFIRIRELGAPLVGEGPQ